jgi:hypothetical protein
MEIGLTTGVTGQQRMLTPLWHITSHLSGVHACCPTLDFVFAFFFNYDYV